MSEYHDRADKARDYIAAGHADFEPDDLSHYLAAAQVHATLALAAAVQDVAAVMRGDTSGGGVSVINFRPGEGVPE